MTQSFLLINILCSQFCRTYKLVRLYSEEIQLVTSTQNKKWTLLSKILGDETHSGTCLSFGTDDPKYGDTWAEKQW